jgi:hypothetical protein
MALKLRCDGCDKDIDKPGALLFSPPMTLMGRMVCEKLHFCEGCHSFLSDCITARRAIYGKKIDENTN